MMNKEKEYILFPCRKPSWNKVCNLLEDFKILAQQPNCNLHQLSVHHQKIIDLSVGIPSRDVDFGLSSFCGLVKFLKHHASVDEKRKFLHSTLPAIVDLVLETPNVLPEDGLAIATQQTYTDIELSRQLVACILACAFLCLFDERGKPWKQQHAKLNIINFTNFFRQLPRTTEGILMKLGTDEVLKVPYK